MVTMKHLAKHFSSFRDEAKRIELKEKIKHKNKEFKGTILENGFCDYEVIEDSWYIEKDMQQSIRMAKSSNARKHRKMVKELKEKKWC